MSHPVLTCTYRHIFSDVLAPSQRRGHMRGHVQIMSPSYTFHPEQPNLLVFQGLDLFPAVQGLRCPSFSSPSHLPEPCAYAAGPGTGGLGLVWTRGTNCFPWARQDGVKQCPLCKSPRRKNHCGGGSAALPP